MRKTFDVFPCLKNSRWHTSTQQVLFKRLINVYDRWCIAYINSICSNADYDSLPMVNISNTLHAEYFKSLSFRSIIIDCSSKQPFPARLRTKIVGIIQNFDLMTLLTLHPMNFSQESHTHRHFSTLCCMQSVKYRIQLLETFVFSADLKL